MELYYGKPVNDKIVLEGDEANHLIQVRRSRMGDAVHVTDGEGHLFVSEIAEIEKQRCTLKILEVKEDPKKTFHLHIAIAPTKNIDRIEWFLEKATETGIDEITFLLCRHSERKEVKPDRLNRVLVAAMKQSMKSFLPKLNPIVDFKSFVSQQFSGTKLICSANTTGIKNFGEWYEAKSSLVALIGPEGDFHPNEIEFAKELNFKPTTLGKSRLRTETAALHVCTLFNFINKQ
jgi:16S rRNA (uracil1498-N3)-methyltransferase